MKRNYEAENEIDMMFRIATAIRDDYSEGRLRGALTMAYLCDIVDCEEKDYILQAYYEAVKPRVKVTTFHGHILYMEEGTSFAEATVKACAEYGDIVMKIEEC